MVDYAFKCLQDMLFNFYFLINYKGLYIVIYKGKGLYIVIYKGCYI